jgi:hypothetical protein
VCCHSSLVLSVLSLLLPINLISHFYVRDQVVQVYYYFFSVLAQPQLLEVGSPEDVDILNRTLLHLVFLFDLFFSLIFLIAIFL